MLALCLQKIKGLNKEVKLVDASFIWTEPHSKRIKVSRRLQPPAACSPFPPTPSIILPLLFCYS